MHVYHDLTTGNAEIVINETTAPICVDGVSQHQLINRLWAHELVLGSTSHWQVIGGRRRHGLDPAPTGP